MGQHKLPYWHPKRVQGRVHYGLKKTAEQYNDAIKKGYRETAEAIKEDLRGKVRAFLEEEKKNAPS